MKSLSAAVLTSTLSFNLYAEGSMIGGGDEPLCNTSVAVKKAKSLGYAIMRLNGEASPDFMETRTKAEEDFFFVSVVFNEGGLSIPVYTVRLHQYDCRIYDVSYSNWEG